MRNEIAAVAVSSLVLATITGCSSEAETPTSDQQTPTSQAAVSDSLPHAGAPAVTTPVDTGVWEAKPCDVLTTNQLSSIGLSDVEAKPDHQSMNGSQCNWYSPNTGGFGATFLTETPTGEPPQGLSAGYANNKENPFEIWHEITIEDQPAVVANEMDRRNRGECGVAVGLRDDLAYSVRVTDPDKDFTSNPCTFAKKVAALAVRSMKGGA